MESTVVIGVCNDSLEPSTNPEVSSESSKSHYIRAIAILVLNTAEYIWFFRNW